MTAVHSFLSYHRARSGLACLLSRFALIAIAVAAASSSHAQEGGDASADPKAAAEPIKVATKTVVAEDVYDSLMFGGFLETPDQVSVYAEVPGVVRTVHVDFGTHVRAGALVATIQPAARGLQYEAHKVYAPQAGYVREVKLTPGTKVGQDDLLFTVTGTSRQRTLTVQLTGDDRFQVDTRTPVDVVLAPGSLRQLTVQGAIVAIAPAANLATGTYAARINVPCPANVSCDTAAPLGSMVRVVMKLNRKLGVKVELSSLFANRAKALLVGPEGKAQWVPVKTGRFFGDSVEIVDGLRSGDTLVTGFSRRPNDGDPLVVENVDGNALGENAKSSKQPEKRG